MTQETTQASIPAWWAMTPTEAAQELESGLEGLTSEEAAARLDRHGRNELTAAEAASVFAETTPAAAKSSENDAS